MDLKGVRLRKQETKRDDGQRRSEDEQVAEEESEPLSPGSRMFHEPDFNVYVIAVLGSKTLLDPDLIRAKLVDHLLKHPRFSSLQVMDEKRGGGEMKWVRTKVDLDKHLIVPDITPEMMESPDQFMEDYIFNLSKTTIDKSMPLWDLHILNVKTSQAEAAAIFRIHHSHGDGTSLLNFLLANTRKTSDPESLPTFPVKKKKQISSSSNGWWFQRYFVACWSYFQLVWNTMVDVFMFMATALFLKDTDTPLKGPQQVKNTARRFVHRTVSLDDFKLVKNVMNATINDVALGVTQAALSRYLNRRYGEIKKDDQGATQKKNNLPKRIRLRSFLLINLRPSHGIQDWADMMENNALPKLENWIGYVLLPFTIGLRDNPLDYVREAKATVDRKKHSLEAIFTFSIAELVLKLFGLKSHKVMIQTTMCFSNLVGPLEEIAFYGFPLAYLAPGSYGQPHALMINFQSHVDKMTIVLSVDEGVIPDPHSLCDEIVESLKLIKDAVIERA